MRRCFKLWLDESGDFKNDEEKRKEGKNPSLIGGILVEERYFKNDLVERIIPQDRFHATEASVGKRFEIFQKIVEQFPKCAERDIFFRLVVFSNEECIMVLNDNLTYQNIMAEGIVQTIKRLKREFGEIKLEVLIANRVKDTKTGGDTVEIEDYEERLRERLIMAASRANIRREEWNLSNASARKDKRLMLADNICNSFLTRNTKFRGERSEFINSVYNDDSKNWIFTVLPGSLEAQFNELMSSNRVGEAVATICQCDVEKVVRKCIDSVSKRLEGMQSGDIELQYRFIKAILEYYLNIIRNYGKCKEMLENMLHYFIPVLEPLGEKWKSNIAKLLSFDLKFYLFTVCTHLGDVSGALECERQCDKELENLPVSWDTIAVRVKYQTRKVINQINLYDFEKALKLCEDLIKQCGEIKELLSIYHEDVKYDELGKALGTKVQIYTFLVRLHKEYYLKAVEASQNAIREFVSDSDIDRQYLYRVNLETEAGKYDEALQYLYRANKLEEDASVKELASKDVSRYHLCAYVRLMAEGRLGNWNRADEMYQGIEASGIVRDLRNREEKEHPMEIILWKYATYCANNRRLREAFGYYDRAVDICFGGDDLTICFIGLAVEFERYAVVLKNEYKDKSRDKSKYKRAMKNHYQCVYEKSELPHSMREIFEEVSWDSEDWEYYDQLSRKITY